MIRVGGKIWTDGVNDDAKALIINILLNRVTGVELSLSRKNAV